jgi:hypothetical protein
MITLDEVVAHPPIVHGGKATFGISPALCRFIDEILTPDAVTLETGTGLSTLVILRRGVARHISVTPYPNELEAIRTYCATVKIPMDAWQAVTGSSLDWLPSATLPSLDLVLIARLPGAIRGLMLHVGIAQDRRPDGRG